MVLETIHFKEFVKENLESLGIESSKTEVPNTNDEV